MQFANYLLHGKIPVESNANPRLRYYAQAELKDEDELYSIVGCVGDAHAQTWQ